MVDTASYADTDLIGLQAHLPGMHSAGDDASGIYPSPSDYSFPEESDSFMTLFPSDDCHGNSQYFPSSSNSPSFRDSQHATFQAPGVSSHHSSSLEVQAQPQDQAPWTHIDVFGREISPSTDDTPTNLLGNPQHLATSVHRPLHSTASGETSVRDSAYCTDPNRSQHGFESVTGLSGEQMDQCGQNYPPVPLYDQQQMATYAPSTSSTTITQAPYNNNNPLSTLPVATQQANQPAASNSNLYCHECNHQAKTRSDFK